MIKTLVLNVDAHTDRMAFQTEQLTTLGIPFSRLPAVTPTEIDPPTDADHWQNWERPLKDVEKAVLLTHCNAWQAVIAEDAPMLILEDDAWLSKTTPKFLKMVKQLTGVEHITLETRGRKKLIAKSAHPDCQNLHRLYQDRTGAAAYILWPNGAQKLLNRTKHSAGLSDAVICAAYDVSSWQATPPLAIQFDMCATYGLVAPLTTTSAITDGPAAREKPVKTARHKWRRVKSQIRMGLREVIKSGIAHKQYLQPDIQPW